MRYVIRRYPSIEAFEADANKHDDYFVHSWHPSLTMAYPKDGQPHPVVTFFVIYMLANPVPKEKEPMACR